MNNYIPQFSITPLRYHLIICSVLWMSHWGFGQNNEVRGILPAHPNQLFPVLPDSVEGWTLTRSKGWLGEGNWIESSVIRDFEELVDKAESERKPGKTRLMIQDTAKFQKGDLSLFSNFKPAKYPRCEYTFSGKNPAIILKPKSGKNSIQVLVRKRWIVTVQIENQPDDSLKKWLKLVALAKLAAIKDGPKISRPESLVSVSIDELSGKSSEAVTQTGGVLEVDEAMAEQFLEENPGEEP